MKKRIIAAIVAMVMLVLSLASCGSFNFAEENLDGYVVFDADAFKKALATIEVEDEDFTTDETVRAQKVVDDLYATLTAAMIKAAGDEDKIKNGTPSERDAVYFCYYCVDADGNVFYTSQMKDSTVTASTTKANHLVQLVDYDEDNELQSAIAEALLAAIGEGKEFSEYKINTTNGTAVNTKTEGEGENAKTPDTVVVSYKVTYELPAVDEDGNPVFDDDNNPTYDSYTKVVNYEEIDLSADTPLATYLRGDEVTMTVGNKAYITEGEGEGATKNYTLKVTETVDENEGVVCSYTEFTVQWIVEEKPDEAYVTVKHTPYTSSNSIEPDNRHNTSSKVDLNDKELTYYIYPVYYVSVPEISATSIMKNILGKNISATTIEIFESEEYKAGDKTVKAMIETLVKTWGEDEDTLKTLKVTVDNAEKTLYDLHEAYNEAADAVTAAGDNATDEQNTAKETTKKAYDDALDAEIDKQIASILTATKADAKAISEVIVEQYKSDIIYKKLKDTYDNDMIEKVGAEVWKLIEKYAVIHDYPADLVEEFVDHLYEGYENEFYTGDKDSSTTNYDYYGDLNTYLVAQVGEDVDAGLEKEAKAAIDPMLKIYAAAKALESDAVAALTLYVEKDIAAGVYDADYEYNDSLSEKKNEKKKAEAEKAAEEAKAEALEDATKFVVTDKVFKEYKKDIGKATYRVWEEQYGEINIRLALQSNRLFYYLLATDIAKNEDGDLEVSYATVGEGESATKVISFRTFTYSIKAETDAE